MTYDLWPSEAIYSKSNRLNSIEAPSSMKCFSAIFAALLTVSTIMGSSHPSQAQTIFPLQQEIPLPGAVFAVTTTPDSKYILASMVALMDGQQGGRAGRQDSRT